MDITDQEVAVLIARVDVDNSGELDFEEFREIMIR